MLALTSCMVFGQSPKTIERQVSKYPSTTNSGKVKKSNATSSALASLSNGAKSAVHGKATVFQENFDGSGPGFEAWTVLDVDGNTPATAVNFITTGWNRIDRQGANGNFGGPAGDYAAMSTSWYAPAGTSNDWLITPSIAIPAGTSTFKWDAKAQDADYPDGYKLMLAPNGGNTVADFTVELYSTAGEDAAWVTRTVNTSAYAGTNVRLAFVNNSTDMFMLLVDNILVDAVAAPVTGCLTATNGQWPSATYTPTCSGTTTNITTAAWLNEYSKVNVTAGTAYTFSTSNASYFITLGNEAGTAVLASGTGSVTYTPTESGVIRFYSHLSSNCDGGPSTTHSRAVKCGTPPPPPAEPEYGCNDQTYDGPWLLANNIVKISETSNFLVANDFFVPMGTDSYSPSSMTITVVPIGGQEDIGNVTVKILNDNNGAPGAVIQTLEGINPVISPLTQTFANYPTFDLTLNLSGVSLQGSGTEAKRYWVAAQVTSKSATPQGIFWIGHQYYDGWQTKPNYQSVDGGATYAVVTNANTPGNFDSNWVIDAECVLAVGEAGNKAVSFYPNPVKDVLNINSKGNIETVHVYNIAGQKMAVPSKLVNGKLDMSKLAPGTYIVSTILQDGKNESFKVIKK